MKSCLFFVIFYLFVCNRIFADKIESKAKECDIYADIPEPPCCGTPHRLEGRINKNNTIPVLDDEVPYFVRVGGGHGALINSRWVVTCSHCIAKNDYIGNVKVNIRGRSYQTDYYIHHPYRLFAWYYGIALVRLKEPVVITSGVQPICLPMSPEFKNFQFYGKNVTVLGFRRGEVNGKKVRKAIGIIPITNTSPNVLITKRITNPGDSGNAMSMLSTFNKHQLIARYIIGLVNASSKGTHMYVRVNIFVEWIKAIILANKD